MIISASYRTDIPTFYGEWFMRRLRAGFCDVRNPYSGKRYRVSLLPGDVDGIVFWTKNIIPFMKHLDEVRDRGYAFVIQHTINGYPRELEEAVVDAARSAEALRSISSRFGERVCVWRYDTILETSITPWKWHIDNFSRLAGLLKNATDEVVLSFAQIYRKTRKNLDAAARTHCFTWADSPAEQKRAILAEMMRVGRSHGLRVSVCAQRELLIEGVVDARCIDADRLAAVSGKSINPKERAHRPACGCHESRDIGEYDTCPHGCVYCYAVQNHNLAQQRHHIHNPDSTTLSNTGIQAPDSSSGLSLPLFPIPGGTEG